MNIAVYTAIFGPYDGLLPQQKFPGVDYICFTDQPYKSKIWDVRQTVAPFDDPTRNSRQIKILPHRYLSSYDVSIFMDGNFLLRKNPADLLKEKLKNQNMLIFDHSKTSDPRNCVYEEYEAILALGEKTGKLKDDPQVMKAQIEKYLSEGYPADNGLISSGVLIRKHNEPDVVRAMEKWWEELSAGSKRDQLSFDYAAWKTDLTVGIMAGDIRDNDYFKMIGKHRKNYRGKYLRYRIKKLLGRE
ncbi:MAG: glycosyltransferase domain-containing protein [Cyclobacteriaceae bacterium]